MKAEIRKVRLFTCPHCGHRNVLSDKKSVLRAGDTCLCVVCGMAVQLVEGK